MPTWPTGFKIKKGSLDETPPKNTTRTNTDKGPGKTRRRTSANVRPISFALILNSEQVQELDDFFVDDTYSGSENFTFTHPRTGDTVTARFATEPKYNDWEGDMYNVPISLEILP